MGLFDVFKNLFPKGESLPWDPQEIRHSEFKLRLPDGWRFTKADWLDAQLSAKPIQATLPNGVLWTESGLVSERLEALRGALRTVEWN